MAKSKKVIINKLEIELHELLVKDIEEAYEKFKDLNIIMALTNMNFVNFVLDKVTKGKLTTDIMKNWAPSDIDECFKAVKEVNSVFFDLLGKIIPWARIELTDFGNAP